MKNYEEAKELWAQLGDIPTNENDEIELPFLGFPVSTHRQEIWHWFEEEFDLSVAMDLMYKGSEIEKEFNKHIR